MAHHKEVVRDLSQARGLLPVVEVKDQLVKDQDHSSLVHALVLVTDPPLLQRALNEAAKDQNLQEVLRAPEALNLLVNRSHLVVPNLQLPPSRLESLNNKKRNLKVRRKNVPERRRRRKSILVLRRKRRKRRKKFLV